MVVLLTSATHKKYYKIDEILASPEALLNVDRFLARHHYAMEVNGKTIVLEQENSEKWRCGGTRRLLIIFRGKGIVLCKMAKPRGHTESWAPKNKT